jgi:hypothetical protein
LSDIIVRCHVDVIAAVARRTSINPKPRPRTQEGRGAVSTGGLMPPPRPNPPAAAAAAAAPRRAASRDRTGTCPSISWPAASRRRSARHRVYLYRHAQEQGSRVNARPIN